MKNISTHKHLLKIFRILLPALTNLILLQAVYAQDTYSLILSDTSTFDTDCGKITSATWSVKNDSCMLYTPYFRKETEGTTVLSYNFRINQSGNGDFTDLAYVQIQKNNGTWVTDTILHAIGYSAVHTLTGSLSVEYNETVRFRVTLRTNANSEFWAVFTGNMTVTGSFETYGGWPPPLGELPVELDYFSGMSADNTMILKWATYSETNCDYFNIQRSFDGINFETIAFVDGAGNSNSYLKYAYVDEDILPVEILYYRLKQVDMDGQFEYFGPVAIEKSYKTKQMEIAPNPSQVSGSIHISLPVTDSNLSNVVIYNGMGVEIVNSVVEGPEFMITLNSPGLYIVAVTNSENKLFDKLIVK